MLSAAQRQRKLAKRAKVRKEMSRIAKLGMIRAARAADRRGPDDWLLIIDKREELFGRGDADGMYTTDQVDTVDIIIDEYTPEQRRLAIALAEALRWETQEEDDDIDIDHFDLRKQQRREQGRGI
jgi:hypothetical protein